MKQGAGAWDWSPYQDLQRWGPTGVWSTTKGAGNSCAQFTLPQLPWHQLNCHEDGRMEGEGSSGDLMTPTETRWLRVRDAKEPEGMAGGIGLMCPATQSKSPLCINHSFAFPSPCYQCKTRAMSDKALGQKERGNKPPAPSARNLCTC